MWEVLPSIEINKVSKVGDHSPGCPKSSLFDSYYTTVLRTHNSLHWIAPLYLTLYLILLSVKQGGIKYHFLSLWYDST